MNFEIYHREIAKLVEDGDQQIFLCGLPSFLYKDFAQGVARLIGAPLEVLHFNSASNYRRFEQLQSEDLVLTKGGSMDEDVFEKCGYERVDRVWNNGEYSRYGDVVVVWPRGYLDPVRISLDGDVVEQITVIDAKLRRSKQDRLTLPIKGESGIGDLPYDRLLFNIPDDSQNVDLVRLVLIDQADAMRLAQFGRVYDCQLERLDETKFLVGDLESLVIYIREFQANSSAIVMHLTGEPPVVARLEQVLDADSLSISDDLIRQGYFDRREGILHLSEYELEGIVDLSDSEITMGESSYNILTQEEESRRNELFKKIQPGDYVVHEDHGVGVFNGVIERKEGRYMEFLYLGEDKLYLPMSQAHKVTRYIDSGSRVKLTKLNGGGWGRRWKRAVRDVEGVARELIQIYAIRSIDTSNTPLSESIDRAGSLRFASTFQYKDTDDQMVATKDILDDLKSGRVMDRLLVGDVGFGKTEIAARAIYAVASTGKQVALLAPTTILVEQHLAVLKSRMIDSGLRIEALSRFLSSADQRAVIARLGRGEIDIIVGTHALLGKDVVFKELGLIVIDEEQKFGVKQKEKLKSHRLSTHTLSLSATPIPRTLNMSLSGVKDISLITTPPEGRRPIENRFEVFEWEIVRDALAREFERGGQAYFLNNRVTNIQFYFEKLKEFFPDKQIEIAHGQMSGEELSLKMHQFSEREIDLLVCTSIIENGIDLPNVNTLIVNDSNKFGLGQLYQIRGRIGRSDKQAYAYFMYKSLRGDGAARMEALKESSELGSGMLIANRDLEIRGAGNLVGKEQSGVINSIGYGLYMQLLGAKVAELKSSI